MHKQKPMTRDGEIPSIAAELAAVLGTGRQIAPFSTAGRELSLGQAYRVADALRTTREARGERPIGRKIGFTNRTIWAEYGVFAPIWGFVYDTTAHDLAAVNDGFSLAGFAEPRIEPEIVFGLTVAPEPGMDEAALLGCIDWIAHGFEIVQSLFPDWRFSAAETVAAFGLHGALLIGPRHPRSERPADAWLADLASFEIDLHRDGSRVDHGRAENVLGAGPLAALHHLVEVLAQDPVNPPLAAGEIVTTGTLTRAFPVEPGETWTTALSGLPLESARLRFV